MGHIDEIGLIVTHIDDDGYLWFRGVGGWDAQILVGQRVVLDTRAGAVVGVVGKKPIHLLREEERKKVADIRDLHIDIGARDGEQARELVRVGDVAVIDAAPVELPNGRLVSRALDNRLGSFVALEAARLIAEAGGAQWEIAAVAAVQEETTFGGSRTSAFALEPDAAIVVDVTHATDAPGIDVKEAGKHELGSGPVISRGSTLNAGAVRAAVRHRRGREDPVHRRGLRARHRHRRRRRAHQPRRRPHRARVDPHPLHALAGRARAARGRARVRAPDRRRRAAPSARQLVRRSGLAPRHWCPARPSAEPAVRAAAFSPAAAVFRNSSSASTSSGRENRKPWPCSQCSRHSVSSCVCSSMPSASVSISSASPQLHERVDQRRRRASTSRSPR